MIKKYYLLPCALILIVIVLSLKKNERHDDKKLELQSVTFPVSSGWGYNILVDKKIFIHQENIPAVMGKKSFVTKQDAMRTSALVIEKLETGKQPTITKDELVGLHISL